MTFLRVGYIASLLVVSMLGFTCQAVCAGGGGGGGGSVANMGFASLYRRPSDWRRAPGISAGRTGERDLVVLGVGPWIS